MKNKKLITGLVMCATVCYLGSNLNVTTTKVAEIKSEQVPEVKKVTEPVMVNTQVQLPTERTPGSNPFVRNGINPAVKLQKSKVTRTFEGVSHPALPENYKLASNIFAVKKDDYVYAMGDVIQEMNGYIFFYSEQRPQNVTNVVIDERNSKLYIISAVVKLRNIDESARGLIVSKGYEEHYYHDSLKIMYLQSTHDEVLKLHEELVAMKLDPQIEIVRQYHRTR